MHQSGNVGRPAGLLKTLLGMPVCPYPGDFRWEENPHLTSVGESARCAACCCHYCCGADYGTQTRHACLACPIRYALRYMFKQSALLRERAARMCASFPPCHIRTVPPVLFCGEVSGAEECPAWTSDLTMAILVARSRYGCGAGHAKQSANW